MPVSRRAVVAVVGLLTTLTLTASQLPHLLQHTTEYSAADRSAAVDLDSLALAFGARYAPYLTLGATAPGADVLLDERIERAEAWLLPELFLTLGRAASVTIVSSEVSEAASPDDAGVGSEPQFAARSRNFDWSITHSDAPAGPDVLREDRPLVRVSPSPSARRTIDMTVTGANVEATGLPGPSERSFARDVRGAARDTAVLLGLLALGGIAGIAGIGRFWRRWADTAVALLLGIAIVVLSTALLLALGLPTSLPIAAGTSLIGALALRRWRTMTSPGDPGRGVGDLPRVAGLAALLGTLAFVLRHDGVIALTPDSITLLAHAELIATDRFPDAFATPKVISWRMLTDAALHALNGAGAGPVLLLGPVMLIVTLGLTGGLATRIAARRLDGALPVAIGILAAALLASIERVLAAAIYVNSHLLIASVVLGMLWIGWDQPAPGSTDHGTSTAVGLVAGLIALSRPEGALLAALVLLPMTFGRRPRVDASAWRWLAAATLLRQVVVLRATWSAAEAPDTTTLAMLVVGVLMWSVPWLLRSAPVLSVRLAASGLAGLWLVAVGVLVLDVERARPSLRATMTNVVEAGGWSFTLLLLGSLALLALLRHRDPEFTLLAVPWIGFVPLGLLLALLRDGTYRIGPGDSLNRMIVHLVPVLVLLVVLAAVGPASDSTPTDAVASRPSARRRQTGVTPAGAAALAGIGLILSLTLGSALGSIGGAPVRSDGGASGTRTQQVTFAPDVIRLRPAGELVTGTVLRQRLAPGLPGRTAGMDPALPLCIELYVATYSGRPNRGVLELRLADGTMDLRARLDMAKLRDNQWTAVCPEGLTVGVLDRVRSGGLLEIASIDGAPGSSATVWLTSDTTYGGLEPVGGALETADASIVHRFVLREEAVRPLLPGLLAVAGLTLVLGLLMTLRRALRMTLHEALSPTGRARSRPDVRAR